MAPFGQTSAEGHPHAAISIRGKKKKKKMKNETSP